MASRCSERIAYLSLSVNDAGITIQGVPAFFYGNFSFFICISLVWLEYVDRRVSHSVIKMLDHLQRVQCLRQ